MVTGPATGLFWNLNCFYNKEVEVLAQATEAHKAEPISDFSLSAKRQQKLQDHEHKARTKSCKSKQVT